MEWEGGGTGGLPRCSFSAEATVSKPKCVVPCASRGALGGGGGGGGVYCCPRLTAQEKHLYGSLAGFLLPASNWPPIRVREACIVVCW